MCNILNNIIYMDPFTTLMVMTSAVTVGIGLKYIFYKCDQENITNESEELVPPRYDEPPEYEDIYDGL
jgi:hypothetical protein